MATKISAHTFVSATAQDVLEMMIESSKDHGDLTSLTKFIRNWIGSDFDDMMQEHGFSKKDIGEQE